MITFNTETHITSILLEDIDVATFQDICEIAAKAIEKKDHDPVKLEIAKGSLARVEGFIEGVSYKFERWDGKCEPK